MSGPMSGPVNGAGGRSARGRCGAALAALLLVHAPGFAQQAADAPSPVVDDDTSEAAAAGANAPETSRAPVPVVDDDAPRAAEADASAAPDDPSSGGLRRVPGGIAEATPGSGSDYPTVARADYVLGCMAANGNTWEALQQCSCSIDYIRERMDWESYEMANTVMQVQLDRGQRGIFYRDSNWAKSRVDRLQALQAESSLRCF